uniref:Photosystem II subunit M n=1 Tax=Mammillaria crucigera TaxID=555420 RepID=A0A5J6VBD4_9CARY|nr:photosystem II subunit M [Mammillaria crucigera]
MGVNTLPLIATALLILVPTALLLNNLFQKNSKRLAKMINLNET